MSQLTSQQFEALWQQSQHQFVMQPAAVQPIQLDLSLSQMLDRFMAMADRFLAQKKIKQADYDELVEAVARLRPILLRINEQDLLSREMSQRAKARGGQRGKKRASR